MLRGGSLAQHAAMPGAARRKRLQWLDVELQHDRVALSISPIRRRFEVGLLACLK